MLSKPDVTVMPGAVLVLLVGVLTVATTWFGLYLTVVALAAGN
jgi:hypothetical protein